MSEISRRDLDRAMDGVANAVGDVADSGVASAKRIEKSIDELGRRVMSATAIASVDLLSSTEVDELRSLIAADDPGAYAESRMKDEAVSGMYLQLAELGLIHCLRAYDGYIVFAGVDPKAAWAVGRRELREREEADRKAEAECRRAEDRKHDTRNMIVGWVAGVVSSLLVSLITGLALSIGLPMK